jgi:hypothetical protein
MGENPDDIGVIYRDPREEAIRALAARQAGNVARRQLLGLGLSGNAIDARLERGSLVKRYAGVYSLPPGRTDPVARIAAAVLAGGSHAVASHTSAAHLWGFITHWAPPPEITLTQGDRRPRHILTHRCPSLSSPDNSLQHGVKVTSRARTVLDIAPILTQRQLRRLVNDARHDNLLTLDALADVITRNPRHPGAKLLRPFVEDPRNPTDSEFEDAFGDFIKKYDLPTPLININRRAGRADAYFPDHGLIVELDGWEFHKDRHAFEDDRERDAENLRVGVVTLRITRERFEADPDREARRLKEILAWLQTRWLR